MRIISLFFLTLLFFAPNTYSEDYKSINCYAHIAKNVCAKLDEDEEPPEVFSSEWADAIIDKTGDWVYEGIKDGVAGFGASTGEQLAQRALLTLADNLGYGRVARRLLGIGGKDHFAAHAAAIIDKLNQVQTELIAHSRTQCLSSVQAESSGTINSINQFLNDDDVQDRIDNRNLLLDYIHSINKYRAYFDSTVPQNSCFTDNRAQTFRWYIRMATLNLYLLAEYHNLDGISDGDTVDAIEKSILDDQELMIADPNGESTIGTAIQLLEKRNDGNNRNNVFNDLNEKLFTGGITKNHTWRGSKCGYDGWRENPVLWKAASSEENRGAEVVEHCTKAAHYKYKGKQYKIARTRFYKMVPAGPNGDWEQEQVFSVYYSGFNKTVNVRDYSSLNAALDAIVSDHKEISYAQVLQNNYLPYVGVLDGYWDAIGKVRPSNKMDRELIAVSGHNRLDGDGLSLYQEIQLGTDPMKADTDGDGFNDGWEVEYGTNPLAYTDPYIDRDGDGSSELQEYKDGTDPTKYQYIGTGCNTRAAGFAEDLYQLKRGFAPSAQVILADQYNYIPDGGIKEIEVVMLNGGPVPVDYFKVAVACQNRVITLIEQGYCDTSHEDLPGKLWKLENNSEPYLPLVFSESYGYLRNGESKRLHGYILHGGQPIGDFRYHAMCENGEIDLVR